MFTDCCQNKTENGLFWNEKYCPILGNVLFFLTYFVTFPLLGNKPI